MQVHPEIAALRREPSPQRLAQERLADALTAWRGLFKLDAIEAELAAFASGAEVGSLALLARLFSAGDAADDLIDGFVCSVSGALRDQPLAQLGQRHFLDERSVTLVLARCGSATLTVQAIDGTAMTAAPAPQTVIFTPNQSFDRVIAGTASANLLRGSLARDRHMNVTARAIDLFPGVILRRDCSCEALQFTGFSGSLLLLKLQRRLPGTMPAREYHLADGALVSQAAGSPRDSRIELAAALLGRMGRTDAAPLLAAVAEEEGGDSLRWQALRECLGLDSASGFRSLSRIATDPADPLAGPAGVLRGQLLEAWPQLSVIEPCPAS